MRAKCDIRDVWSGYSLGKGTQSVTQYEYRLTVIFTKVYLISISTCYNKIYVYNRYTNKTQSELQFMYTHKNIVYSYNCSNYRHYASIMHKPSHIPKSVYVVSQNTDLV
jgi:hypothetical protein